MTTFNLKCNVFVVLSLISSFTTAAPASSQHASQASKHSALAASHIVVGTVKATANIIAIPLIAIGSVGELSNKAGTQILSSTQAYSPLEISDLVITQDPSPTAAMQ